MVSERFSFFRSRSAAGQLLGERLAGVLKGEAIVVSVSSGGFPVADSVAGALHAASLYLPCMDIPDPTDPKKTIGAVNFGYALTHQGHDLPASYLHREAQRLQQELRRQFLDQSAVFNKVLEGKQVVIVNDIVENPAVVVAAVKLVTEYRPAAVILAAPLITIESFLTLSSEVQEIVVLETVSTHMLKYAFSQEDHFELS